MEAVGAAEWLLTQGVLGLAVLALGYAVARLYLANKECERARVTDAKEMLPIIEAMKATLAAQLAAMEARNRQTDKIVEAVSAMEARVGSLMQQNEANLQRAFDRLDRLQSGWDQYDRRSGR